MKSIEACFFERTKGVIPIQFSYICSILSENCSRYLPCCLWKGTPKLFPFSLLAYISEASFSTRSTNLSTTYYQTPLMRILTAVAFWDPSATDPALLCKTGVLGGFLVQTDGFGWDPHYTLCLWAVLFLPASPQSAEVLPQTTCPEHSIQVCQSSNPRLPGPWSSFREQSKPLQCNFRLRISFLFLSECVCVFTCLKKKKRQKTKTNNNKKTTPQHFGFVH